MSFSSLGKHAGGGTSNQFSVPEPSFAEQARTLMHVGRTGSLSTLSRKQPGFPFGSLMPYALDGQGRPLFLISTMAMHTQNLQADPRASLFVTEPDASGDPLGASRVTLIGTVSRIPEPEDALVLLAKRFAGIEAQEAEMTSIDRLGFHLRLKTQDGVKGTRVAFLREVSDPSETREVFVEMVQQARQG